MKKIGNLLGSEGANAATVLALSGTRTALVAEADGLLSQERAVAKIPSNPVTAVAARCRRYFSLPPPPRQVTA